MATSDIDYMNVRQNSSLDHNSLFRQARGFISGNQPNSIITNEGLTLVIKKGNIADEMVNGLANSVGGHFNLSEGAIAKSILQRAGSKIQEELTRVSPKNPRFGDVVETMGHNLSASYVFHGVLKKWGRGQDDSEKVLRCFINNVLTAAEKRRLSTVAFPAVGSGGLGFPADVVATCLFEECDRFSECNPSATLSEVRFVIYEKDTATFNAFEKKLSDFQLTGSQSNNAASDDDDDDDDDDDSDGMDPSSFVTMLIQGLKTVADRGDQQQQQQPPRRQQQQQQQQQQLDIGVPSTWSDADPYDPYKRIKLDPSDSEYKSVVQNLNATAGGAAKQIIKIERIENHRIWKLYMLTKQDMERVNGTQINNERLLWHGTSIDALDNIYGYGFNRSYCGKNAVAFGKGAYFARDFSYSAQRTYSPPDPSGNRYIFQCRVLTGHFTVGTPQMIEPPMRTQKLKYDSTTNDVSDPAIFVIFKDNHAYPEYLVTFK